MRVPRAPRWPSRLHAGWLHSVIDAGAASARKPRRSTSIRVYRRPFTSASARVLADVVAPPRAAAGARRSALGEGRPQRCADAVSASRSRVGAFDVEWLYRHLRLSTTAFHPVRSFPPRPTVPTRHRHTHSSINVHSRPSPSIHERRATGTGRRRNTVQGPPLKCCGPSSQRAGRSGCVGQHAPYPSRRRVAVLDGEAA